MRMKSDPLTYDGYRPSGTVMICNAAAPPPFKHA